MPLAMNAHQRKVCEAQQKIFNVLCTAFRHSGENPEFLFLVDDLRAEVDIPPDIFAEALEKFADSPGENIVIPVEQKENRYITLGESAKSNISDWIYIPQPARRTLSNT
jgi:hypothetical protein